MKKALSILLSVVITLSTVVGIFISPANAALPDATYFETLSNWKFNYPGADSTMSNFTANNIKKLTTDSSVSGAADGSAVKFPVSLGYVAVIKLPDIEANSNYTLRFRYNGEIPSSAGKYQLYWSGIYAGTTAIPTGSTEITPSVASINGSAGVTQTGWKDYQITFDSGNNTDLYFAVKFWNGSTVWFDDFSLTENIVLDYYENPENWQYNYPGDSTTIKTLGNNTVYKAVTDRTVSFTEGQSSVKFGLSLGYTGSIKLPALEKGKSYTLSFKYKGDWGGSATKYQLYYSGIYSGNTAVPKGSAEITPAIASQKGDAGISDKEWHDYSITFTVDNDIDLYFAVKFWNGSTVWFDDFKLTDTSPNPYETTEFNQVTNWKLYANKKFNDESATQTSGWAALSKNTTVADGINLGESSIKFYGSGAAAGIKLNGIEKGKKYKFSFKYKAPTTTTLASSKEYFSNPGIYKATDMVGAQGDLSGITAVVSGVAPKNTTNAQGEWHLFEIEFDCTDSTELYFAMRFWLGGGDYTVYIDNVDLEDITPDPNDTTAYNLQENWKVYDNGTKIGDASATNVSSIYSYYTITANSAKEGIYSGKSSLKTHLQGVSAGIRLQDLEIGKSYKLSFKYMSPTSTTLASAKTYFNYPGIYKSGTEVGTSGAITNAIVSVAAPKNDEFEQGEWHTFEIPFTCEETTDLYFAMQFWYTDGFEMYIDDVELTSITILTEGEGYFEKLSNWQLDAFNVKQIGENPASKALKKIVKDTAAENELSTYALEFDSTSPIRTSIKLNVEPKKEYDLEFSFYSENAYKKDDLTSYIISAMGIYAKGAKDADLTWRNEKPNGFIGYLSLAANNVAMFKDDTALYNTTTRIGTTTAAENYPAGQWNTVKFSFCTDNYSEDIFFTALLAQGLKVYFDDIKLTEKVVLKHDYDNPADETIITFDDARPYNFEGNRLSIAEGPENNGIKTNALKIVKREYDKESTSATTLNWGSVVTNKNDPVFCIPVKPNTTYEFSVDAFFTATSNGAKDQDQNLYFADMYQKNDKGENVTKVITYIDYSKAEKNKWKNYSTYIKTGADQTVMCITFNAKAAHPEFYLDNLTVKVADLYEYDYANPKDKEVITFDDKRPYSFEGSTLGIAKVPVKLNGKKTNALKVAKREYDEENKSATTLNWGSVVNNKNDQIYCIPVKPNQNYKFSVDALFTDTFNGDISQDQNLYFADMYQENENGTSVTKVITYIDYSKAEKNKWKNYSTYIKTGADQTVMCITFNAKAAHPEFYLDNLTVEKIDLYEYDYNNPKIKEIITFDDVRPYSFEVGAIEIAKAPARDGKSSNAMHIIKGDYSKAVTLNYSKTVGWQGKGMNTDPVFSLPVKENRLYHFSVWAYLPKDEVVTYGVLYANVHDSSTMIRLQQLTASQGEWVKLEHTFQTSAGQDRISMYFNFGFYSPEMYFDDFALEELLPGVSEKTNNSYCEHPYNIVDTKLASDIESAKTGVYKIALTNCLYHTFGITAKGSDKTSICLSFDGKTPIPAQNEENIDGLIKPSLTETRYGLKFVSGTDGYIYIIINNPDNSLELSDVHLYKALSINTNREMGYDYNPNVKAPELDIFKLKVDGAEDSIQAESESDTQISNDWVEDTTDSPETGDSHSIVLAMLFMVTALSALAITYFYRKGKVANNE